MFKKFFVSTKPFLFNVVVLTKSDENLGPFIFNNMYTTSLTQT